MRTMLRKLPLCLALLILTQCSHCKRNDPAPQPPKDPLSTLPPETQTGAGTVACLVNGKIFICPYPTSVRGDWQSLTRFSLGTGISLDGQQASQNITLITTMNGQLGNNQVFSLISSATPFPIFTPGINQFTIFATVANSCSYSGAHFKTGQVELVKFDGVARIAAGRFAFTLYKPGGCDTLRVTKGRFDVKF